MWFKNYDEATHFFVCAFMSVYVCKACVYMQHFMTEQQFDSTCDSLQGKMWRKNEDYRSQCVNT